MPVCSLHNPGDGKTGITSDSPVNSGIVVDPALLPVRSTRYPEKLQGKSCLLI